MNTGVQRSGATPAAARTATTEADRTRTRQRLRPGQEPPAARDGARDPLRRHGHRRRPARPRGQGRTGDGAARRALPARPRPVPARLGHRPPGTPSASPASPARRDCSRCSRRPTGRSWPRRRSAVRVRVEAYLRPQRRFAHLFAEPPRTDDIARIQAIADRNIRRFGLLGLPPEEGKVSEHPFAVTLDAGSSRANHTGIVAGRAARLRRPPAALQRRLPGRREHPALVVRRRGRLLRGGLAHARRGQPPSGDLRAGLLPPLRGGLQPGQARRGGRDPRRRAVPRRRGDRPGLAPARARRALGPPGPRRGRRALGPLRRLPPHPPRARGGDPRGCAQAGRDAALRNPQVPPAPGGDRRRGRPRSATSGS